MTIEQKALTVLSATRKFINAQPSLPVSDQEWRDFLEDWRSAVREVIPGYEVDWRNAEVALTETMKAQGHTGPPQRVIDQFIMDRYSI